MSRNWRAVPDCKRCRSRRAERFLIAENVKGETEARSEIVFVNVVKFLSERREGTCRQVEVLQSTFFLAADAVDVIA